jgi:D-lactate dehydrogenase (cytochrome)
MSVVNRSLSSRIPPFPEIPHLFFKVSGSPEMVSAQQKTLSSILSKHGAKEIRMAKDDKEAIELWDIRKNFAYSVISAYPGTDLISTDVCVPLSRLPVLIERYKKDADAVNEEILRRSGGDTKKTLTSLVMGHVGDGNFHSAM